MKKITYEIVALAVLLVACSTTKTENSGNSVVIHPGLEAAWMIDGMAQPESVLSIPGHPWLYVSNINFDEAGYISRIAKDGTVEELHWVDGIQTPTGMGYWDGNLYVANQDSVVVIDIEDEKIVKTLETEAGSLNDISISDDGEIYVSDLETNSIYKVKGDRVELWLQSDDMPLTNGILADRDDLYVLSSATEDFRGRAMTPDIYGSVYRVDTGTKEIRMMSYGEKIGALDGIVPYKEGYIVSDPFNNSLIYLSDRERILMGYAEGGAADIGSDADEASILYVPLLFAGKVAAYNIIDEEWIHITTEKSYQELAADRTFGSETGRSVATSDGMIKGAYNAALLSGTWEWKGEFFSRVSTLGDRDLGHDNIAIYVNDEKIKLILNEGGGMQVIDRKISEKDLLTQLPVKAEKLWTIDGLVQVESVLSIPGHDYLYASVLNREEMGYLAKLSKDGAIIKKKWSEGVASPAGMGYYDGYIYVSDMTRVHKIDLETGRIVKTYVSEGPTLNDITISGDGEVYVSNVFAGAIYKIEGNGIVPWLTASEELLYPNGLLDEGDRLIAVTTATIDFMQNRLSEETYGSAYEITKADKSIRPIKTGSHMGALDGITAYGDGYLVSDPFGGSLFYIDEDVKLKVADLEGGAADIFADAEDESILYVPMLFGNGVMACKISSTN